MSKQKLFLDFDNTICNSIQSFCSVYNIFYQDQTDFKPAIWQDVKMWNFLDQCPILEGDKEKVHNIFEHNLFFNNLELMDDCTREVIEKLCEKYTVIVASIGTPLNIARKSLWLRDNLPCIKDYVLLVNDGNVMCKELVNMESAVFLDDVVSNLDSVNAKHKIIFGKEYIWNLGSSYERCMNWTDVGRLLL